MKKLKLLILSFILTSLNAHAGVIDFITKRPIVSSIGVATTAIYLESAMHKARKLSYNLNMVEPYFQNNPQDYNPIAKYVWWALNNPNNKQDYDRYAKLAYVMGIDNIPPYMPPVNNQPPITTYPQPTEEYNNPILENPADIYHSDTNIIYTPEGVPIDTSTEFPISKPKNWVDYLLNKANSKILADNMEKAGMGKKPKDYAAHHIIPATDKDSQIARDILKKYGIDINDPINGVYLPTAKNIATTQGIEHNGRHPQSYSNKINNLISLADNKGGVTEILKTLQSIKNTLQSSYRYNKWENL